ncbi:mechanosensitive ion channel family protein [Pseudochryseolinea flava]|uniref:Mechanosensitive ion channel family protein n=2 Tax=Pseudochryseolinea flava TaxID=2059302 RepID=A0A364Y6S2_9BACT|nr:mechanosensitive ion channel family protein [Pseudochryseolinea flava]
MDNFINREIVYNSIADYLVVVGIIIAGIVVIRITRLFIANHWAKGTSERAHFIAKGQKLIIPILHVLLIFAALKYLTFPEHWLPTINSTFVVALVFLIVRAVTGVVKIGIHSYVVQHHETAADQKLKQINGIVLVLNAIIWVLGVIFLFDNLGFNVTAVITGLGVGGIAIALAAQTILGDIFNYFVIFFDRPFELGDFIIVDDKMGTIEYIGLKTTRIRSLQGEQIIFSNSNLTNSRINNYKSMKERRVVFVLRIVYKTSHDILQQIPIILRAIIEEERNTRFDRAHFARFETYSLDFEVVYFIKSGDYNQYMDTQQRINLAICVEFERREIQFALPLYHLKLEKQEFENVKSYEKYDSH